VKDEQKDELEGGLSSRRDLLSIGGRLAAMAAMAPLLEGIFDSPASASTTMAKLRAAGGGGTVIEGNQADPTTFNPLVGQDFAAYIVAATCFNGLLTIDKNGHPQPAIATALPKVTNNSNTYTFKLRSNAKWSDGTPLTADDVVFTFELMFSPKYKDFACAYSGDAKAYIKSAKAINAHTFQLTTKKPYAPLLLELCTLGLLPKHVLGKMTGKQLNTAAYNLKPTVVNGPFTLVNWAKGSQITFAANPHYWRGKPKLSQYIIKIIANPTSIVQQLQTGAIQVGPVTSDQYTAIANNSQIDLIKFPSTAVEVATFQLRPTVPVSKFFKDTRVRQALWWALDRKAIIKSVWFGTGALFTNSPEPPGTSAYTANTSPNYQHNPGKAKQLLDAAGWKMGPGGVRQKNGVKAQFTIMTTTNPQYVTTIEAMAQQWKAVGVDVATRPVPIGTIIDQLAQTRTFDMIMIANNLLSADPDLSAYYHSRNTVPGGLNGGDYKNPKMDSILDKQLGELDVKKRLKLLHEFQNVFGQDPPGIPVLSLTGAYGVRKNVKNESFNTYNQYTPRPWLSSVTVGK
jgi:peptide/nickel transport system substrate-binding protein